MKLIYGIPPKKQKAHLTRTKYTLMISFLPSQKRQKLVNDSLWAWSHYQP